MTSYINKYVYIVKNYINMKNSNEKRKDWEKRKAYLKIYNASHKEKIKEYNIEYQKNNKEKIKEYKKEYNINHNNVVRDYRYKKTFKSSLLEYNKMFTAQNGCCAICGTHQSKLKRRLAPDHNHETGKIRELLCSGCNTGIGLLKHDPKILLAAFDYLIKHADT